MAEIKKVTKKTENPYVNLYELDTLNRKGNPGKYYVASRAKSIQTLELTTGSQHSDGVIIYSLYGENHDRVFWFASTDMRSTAIFMSFRQVW